uniref:invasin domain 3-containing protein n=1 Tax=Yersinia pseudotuberculosis TaxID=633 RepID=UPI003D81416B
MTLNGDSGNLSTTHSTLVAAPVSIEANGSDTSLVTLTLRDSNNNPVTGQTVALVSTLGTLGAVTEQASGVYTATLTAGTVAGVASLSVSVGGSALGVAPATVTLNGDSGNLSTTHSTLVAAPVSIEANGSDTSLVTLTLRDSNNNPVTGQTVALVSTLGTLGAVTEQASGVYTATLTAGTVAGVASLSVSVGGSALGVAPATVTLNGDSGNLSTTHSTLVAAPVNIEANGSDTSLVTLTLRDSNNNPVTGQTVALVSTLGTLGAVTEQASGIYTATLTAGTLTGTASLSVNVDGNSLGITPATVNVIPAPVDLTVSVDNARKNIGQAISLTVTAKYKSTDVVAPNVKMTFEQVAVVNRQNNTVSISGAVQIAGVNYNSFTGMTDANGQLTVSVTDPNGIGVQTTLKVRAESGDTGMENVIFNVLTSPNTSLANMWGYMSEVIINNGITFKRPLLKAEDTSGDSSANSSSNYANEIWAVFTNTAARAVCSSLPTRPELSGLYSNYPTGSLTTTHGWRTDFYRFRSNTPQSTGFSAVNFLNGTFSSADNTSYDYVSCKG